MHEQILFIVTIYNLHKYLLVKIIGINRIFPGFPQGVATAAPVRSVFEPGSSSYGISSHQYNLFLKKKIHKMPLKVPQNIQTLFIFKIK